MNIKATKIIADHPLISKTMGIAAGRARVVGTNIRVSAVVEMNDRDLSIDDMIAIYSELSKEKILAALEYDAARTDCENE